MKENKKILILIILIIAGLIFSFYDTKNEEENTPPPTLSSNNFLVNVKLEGEVIEYKTIVITKGQTYNTVLIRAKSYLNEYSYTDCNLTQRLYEDTSLKILSYDSFNEYCDTKDGKININEASLQELIKIYGIGEKRAQKIITSRSLAKISTFTELKKLLGVADEVITRIKEQATL